MKYSTKGCVFSGFMFNFAMSLIILTCLKCNTKTRK